jgi:uncharacterized protein YjiS (DUF1127 family)
MHKPHGGVSGSDVVEFRGAFIFALHNKETLKTERNGKETDMTTATTAQSHAGSLLAGAEQTAGTVAERLRASWQSFRAYRATLAELNGLTDRQLADAGIDRTALRETARGAAYGILR